MLVATTFSVSRLPSTQPPPWKYSSAGQPPAGRAPSGAKQRTRTAGPGRLGPRHGVLGGAAHGDHGPGPGQQAAAGARRRDGLQVQLLQVGDVPLVEGRVLAVEAVHHGRVQRVRRLGHGGGRLFLAVGWFFFFSFFFPLR